MMLTDQHAWLVTIHHQWDQGDTELQYSLTMHSMTSAVQEVCPQFQKVERAYPIQEVDGVCVEESGVGHLGVADGVKQLLFIINTEWRLCAWARVCVCVCVCVCVEGKGEGGIKKSKLTEE